MGIYTPRKSNSRNMNELTPRLLLEEHRRKDDEPTQALAMWSHILQKRKHGVPTACQKCNRPGHKTWYCKAKNVIVVESAHECRFKLNKFANRRGNPGHCQGHRSTYSCNATNTFVTELRITTKLSVFFLYSGALEYMCKDKDNVIHI